ncbi:hypothetical protein Tsp_10212 [Trichinella spiralis]|uniref:hypothetical protein n=1 Tax=Trichinella spiralis TaxID=6334 RepID=UPI0001EFDDEF|nr:hypothetical protein Tsp_10212 [Trichinella spiralis]
MIVAKSCCFTCQRISALATNCQGSLKLVYDSSRQMSYFHIHPAKPSFHSSAGSLCDHPIHIYSSFVFPGTKMLRQKCHYAFVLIRSRWMGKKVGDSTRSIQIQCADGVVIHAHIGRNLADVYVRSNWLEPDLWLGYPDREKKSRMQFIIGSVFLISFHFFYCSYSGISQKIGQDTKYRDIDLP